MMLPVCMRHPLMRHALMLGALLMLAGRLDGVAAPAPSPVDSVSQQVARQLALQAERAPLSGAAIVRESLRRHELYPYVYEEQTLILSDAEQHYDVRRIRRYSRLDSNHSGKTKIEFIYPDSIAGTALLFIHHADGHSDSRIFLPALGARMTDYVGAISSGQLLGSEFSLQDLMPENMAEFSYHRDEDVVIDGQVYFAVRARFSDTAAIIPRSAYSQRLLLMRQDNFFMVRVDYYDRQSRLVKRLARHDIHRVGGDMWRADMITVESIMNHQRSTLKIDRRVFSSTYVPESVFDEAQMLKSASAVNKADPATMADNHVEHDTSENNREEKR